MIQLLSILLAVLVVSCSEEKPSSSLANSTGASAPNSDTGDGQTPADSDSEDLNEEATTDSSGYESEWSIEENLAAGISLLEMLEHHEVMELYGVFHQGGYLFYVDGETGMGLVMHTLSEDEASHWNDFSNQAQGLTLGSAIGMGSSNTDAIVAALGQDTYAARYAYDAEINGYNDWFVPSIDELTAIYEHLHLNNLGNADSGLSYWSSTDEGQYAWVIYFANGNTYTPSKFHQHHNVLPVRTVQ